MLTLQLQLQLVLFYFLFSPGLDTAQSHLVTFYIFSYMQLCQQRCTDDQLPPYNNQLLICKITMVKILKNFFCSFHIVANFRYFYHGQWVWRGGRLMEGGTGDNCWGWGCRRSACLEKQEKIIFVAIEMEKLQQVTKSDL